MSTSDPFSARFDAIAVDPANAPSAEAIDRALAFVAPAAAAPEGNAGFYLMNDAAGRFIVDREMGIITVASDSVLTRDLGQLHNVRLKVIEASGAHYELEMALKITGPVPQMVGAEDLFGPAEPATTPAPAPIATPAVDRRPLTPWTRFAATQDMAGAHQLGSEQAPYGALLTSDLSHCADTHAELRLSDKPPRPSRASAEWPR